jgi:D-threonate/D-erythronate kinase
MSATVAVVADDLTGAADAAAGFLRASLSVALTWPAPSISHWFIQDSDVIAIDARTRVLDRQRATAVTADVVSTLFGIGLLTIYKKIDSTLRGHIGAEVRATLDAWHSGTVAVVAPAFPAMGRTTIDGRQRLNGVLLDRPALAALLEQAGLKARTAGLEQVRGGTLHALFDECQRDKVRAIVCDAEIDADLHAIAEAGADRAPRIVWVGSAGLAHAVAAGVGPRRGPVPRSVISRGESGGVLAVVGSRSSISREQAGHLTTTGVTTIEVPLSVLETADPGMRLEYCEALVTALRRGDLLVRLPTQPDDTENPALAHRLADLLAPCGSVAKALVITGGETATHLLDAWRVQGLTLVDEVEPGVPLGITLGDCVMPIVTKAGAFGETATLARAMTRLREMTIDHHRVSPRGDSR